MRTDSFDLKATSYDFHYNLPSTLPFPVIQRPNNRLRALAVSMGAALQAGDFAPLRVEHHRDGKAEDAHLTECPPSQHPVEELREEGVGEFAFGGDGVEMLGEADAIGGLLQEARFKLVLDHDGR